MVAGRPLHSLLGRAEGAERAAVPGALAVDITKSLGDLSGKVILDPTNVVDRNTGDGYANHGVPGGSNAELIQAAAPNAKVVKAFNTLNWTKMVDPQSSGGPVSIPIVGDDPASAGTMAAGLWEFLRDAADSKQLHTAKAASDGLLAAYLARDGFTGATRLPIGLARRGGWTDTGLQLPHGEWQDALTGNSFRVADHGSGGVIPGGAVRVGDVLGRYPVALLLAE